MGWTGRHGMDGEAWDGGGSMGVDGVDIQLVRQGLLCFQIAQNSWAQGTYAVGREEVL